MQGREEEEEEENKTVPTKIVKKISCQNYLTINQCINLKKHAQDLYYIPTWIF